MLIVILIHISHLYRGSIYDVFVPSWYHGNEYKENEQYFYVRRAVTEFDDSVKQIQMFNRNDIMDYKIFEFVI